MICINKMTQMSCNFKEQSNIVRTGNSFVGEKPARGSPKPPPTPPRPDLAEFTRGENTILGRGTRNPHAELRRGEKEGGKNNAIRKSTELR